MPCVAKFIGGPLNGQTLALADDAYPPSFRAAEPVYQRISNLSFADGVEPERAVSVREVDYIHVQDGHFYLREMVQQSYELQRRQYYARRAVMHVFSGDSNRMSPDSSGVRFSQMSVEAEIEMGEWDQIISGKAKK